MIILKSSNEELFKEIFDFPHSNMKEQPINLQYQTLSWPQQWKSKERLNWFQMKIKR